MAEAATLAATDLREHLRQALAVLAGQLAVQAKAAKAAVRGDQLVAEAEARLASFASLDEKIAAHHADAIRAQTTAPSLQLPPALAAQRAQRQQATEDIAAAKAALALLEGELQQATHAANAAEAAAAAEADAILRQAADALADELALVRAKAWALEDQLHALAALWLPGPSGNPARRVSPRAVAILQAEARPGEPVGGSPARFAAALAWRQYHAALLADPAAVFG
jgi:hypothetical protein